jgi:hypothetical protein
VSRRAIVAGSAAIALFVVGIGIVIAVELGAFSSNPAPVQAAPPLTTPSSSPGNGGLAVLSVLPRRLFGGLPTAAAYLGMSQAKLRLEVAHGHTLAELAKAKGKSIAGLTGALIVKEKKLLSSAVSAGTISRAQARLLEANLARLIDDVIRNGVGETFAG